MVFIAQSTNVVNYLYRFSNSTPALHSWDKLNLVMIHYLFYTQLYYFNNMLFRILTSMFLSEMACNFSFSGFHCLMHSLNEFGSIPYFSILQENIYKIGIIYSLEPG